MRSTFTTFTSGVLFFMAAAAVADDVDVPVPKPALKPNAALIKAIASNNLAQCNMA